MRVFPEDMLTGEDFELVYEVIHDLLAKVGGSPEDIDWVKEEIEKGVPEYPLWSMLRYASKNSLILPRELYQEAIQALIALRGEGEVDPFEKKLTGIHLV